MTQNNQFRNHSKKDDSRCAFLKKSFVLTLLIFSLSRCSLFFGSIRPVEEKSTTYGILDLSKESSEWVRLDKNRPSDSEAPEHSESAASDIAFQSRKTAAIISLNSACKNFQAGDQNLKKLTQELLLGISQISFKEEKERTLQNSPALETTIQGVMSGEKMILQTLVIKNADCIYDLIYITRPDTFSENKHDFDRFISSLSLQIKK